MNKNASAPPALIRSAKSKREVNLQKLIEAFQEKKELSIQDICDHLECSRKSAYDYLHLLQEHYEIISFRKGHKFYTFAETEKKPEETAYLPLTADIIRKYCILQGLQERPCKKRDFKNKFAIKNTKDRATYSDCIPIDIGTTYFYRLLNQLIAEGEIILDQDTYYLSGKNVPLIWELQENKLMDISDALSNAAPGSPYYEQFKSIYDKLRELLDPIDIDNPSKSNYLLYGKNHAAFKTISEHLHRLDAVDYKNRIVEITHTTNKNEIRTVSVAIGLVVYCQEKDKIYIIGEDCSAKQSDCSSKYTVIKIATINGLKETPFANRSFLSQEYTDISNTMFSISIEEPVDVIVEFDIFGNIERKIQYLKNQREKSTIGYNPEHTRIIYSDRIRGLKDFAAYLRQFGRAAHVKEPKTLVDIMNHTVTCSLERYSEVTNAE